MALSYPGKFMHRLQLMSFVDCTMTNIQNYSLSEIVTSVPEYTIPKNCILDTTINIPHLIIEFGCRKKRFNTATVF
jgi:hypothetical protein